MFTGIIEEIGEIQSIKKGEKSSRIAIKASEILKDTQIGDSISTNGVCLTVTNITCNNFEVDVMAETLRKSNLGDLKPLDRVNLERALSIKSRLGGHIVSGHIDGVGKILSFIKEDNAVWITIRAPLEILRYIVLKGSIAIDGVSLTVAYINDEVFKVSIIPHTGEGTILLKKRIGETVNLECDLIGKYVEKLLKSNERSTGIKESIITENFLKNNGFL